MDNSFPVGIFVLSGLCQLKILVVEMSTLFIVWYGVVWCGVVSNTPKVRAGAHGIF